VGDDGREAAGKGADAEPSPRFADRFVELRPRAVQARAQRFRMASLS
jgi:hypothetical protein